MEEREAIRELEWAKNRLMQNSHMDNNRIMAFSMAFSALEKQVAKKPDIEGDGYDPDGNLVYDTWICPTCGVSYEIDYDKYDYCPSCGQKIDWEAVENDGKINK